MKIETDKSSWSYLQLKAQTISYINNWRYKELQRKIVEGVNYENTYVQPGNNRQSKVKLLVIKIVAYRKNWRWREWKLKISEDITVEGKINWSYKQPKV